MLKQRFKNILKERIQDNALKYHTEKQDKKGKISSVHKLKCRKGPKINN